ARCGEDCRFRRLKSGLPPHGAARSPNELEVPGSLGAKGAEASHSWGGQIPPVPYLDPRHGYLPECDAGVVRSISKMSEPDTRIRVSAPHSDNRRSHVYAGLRARIPSVSSVTNWSGVSPARPAGPPFGKLNVVVPVLHLPRARHE